MKLTISFLLCLFLLEGYSQTTPLTFTVIGTGSDDLNRPNGGANQWNFQNVINIPNAAVSTQRLDAYFRFTWINIQPAGGSPGVYDWTRFDHEIQGAIGSGQSFSFGVMQQCGGCDANQQTVIGGAKLIYPTWLHNQMQAESPTDYIAGGIWWPNYNSPSFLAAWKALQVAINAHIMATSFNGVRYRDVIFQVDIRGYGDYGEWTENDFSGPSGTVATDVSKDSLISATVHAFETFQVVGLQAMFDGNQLGNTMNSPAVGYYALTTSNSKGRLGWRRDNWGSTLSYNHAWTDLNPTSFGGIDFDTAIMNRYKFAPILGEPGNETGSVTDISNETPFWHVSSFGNGNITGLENDPATQAAFRAASKSAGYRIVVSSGTMTTSPPQGSTYNITLQLKNVNGIPPYDSWKLVYEWWNGGTMFQRDTSAFDLRLFYSTTDVAYSSNILLRTVPAGSGYELHLKVVNPTGTKIPMPLFITGRLADGGYIMRSGITVTSSGAVANAGNNQNITTASTTLDGSASTGATSYLWTRLSGPNTPTIVTPTTVTTSVTGLITGTYVFQLAINGGSSGQLISQVNVIVNATPVQANAGNSQTITLPTSTVTLNGSLSTGATTYVWTNVSGPNTPSITNPNNVSTSVNGLIAGNYIFQLSINSGASTSQTSVTVLPIPAPVANAGPSQTISLPTSSVTVSGSASSGTITSYAWSRLSGPNVPTFGTPTAVSTTISGLIVGTYVIQLSLNAGAATDTMQIVVNQAPPPPSINGTTVFTTQTPNSGTVNDNTGGLELGMKFQTTTAGYVTGVRFYKTTGNDGVHIGQLYTSAGSLLATATFTVEGVSGWQTVQFVPAIPILANTTYVVAYYSPNGNYVATSNYFGTAVVNSPLTGLADGTDGHNGVYDYSGTPVFPTSYSSAGNMPNYWVDVVFSLTNPGTIPVHQGHHIYFKQRP